MISQAKCFKSEQQICGVLTAVTHENTSISHEKKKIRLSTKYAITSQQQNVHVQSNLQKTCIKNKELNTTVSKCRSISGIRKSVPIQTKQCCRQSQKKVKNIEKSVEKLKQEGVPNKIKQLMKAHSREIVDTRLEGESRQSTQRSKQNKMRSSSKISPKKSIKSQIFVPDKLGRAESFNGKCKQNEQNSNKSLERMGDKTQSFQEQDEKKDQQKQQKDECKKRRSSRKCQLIKKQSYYRGIDNNNDQFVCNQTSIRNNNKLCEKELPSQKGKAQFNRLLQITSKCVQYYNKFLQQKEAQIYVINDAFNKIQTNLDQVFDGLINNVRQKQRNIKTYLNQKYENFIKIKQTQDSKLRSTLQQIKEIHLPKMLHFQHDLCNQQKIQSDQKYRMTPKVEKSTGLLCNKQARQNAQKSYSLQIHQISGVFQDISIDNQKVEKAVVGISKALTQYASSLKSFYEKMEQIEQYDFKESVEESINFINNLIAQQIKMIIDQKVVGDINFGRKDHELEGNKGFTHENRCELSPNKSLLGLKHENQKNANMSFSFNCEKILSRMSSKASLFPDSTHDLLRQIQSFQDRRKNNIKRYSMLLR